MFYKGDIGLYLSGAPVPIPNCALYIIQPNIKQIVQFGETNFLMAVHLLGQTEDYLEQVRKVNSELKQLDDFQLLMLLIKEDPSVKKYLNSFFELTFPDYSIKYESNAILFYLKDSENKNAAGMVTMYSFNQFQEIIKELFVIETDAKDTLNPANETAKKIAEKIKKGRQRKNQETGEKSENISLFGTYVSILSVGLSIDMNIFFNYTPFQLIDSFKRYWEKVKYDFHMKVTTTPLMDTSKMEEPEEWTRNLYPTK